MEPLTAEEKRRFEEWIIANITARIVPSDEANGEALVFNLVHLIRGDGERYQYIPMQDEEINNWFPE